MINEPNYFIMVNYRRKLITENIEKIRRLLQENEQHELTIKDLQKKAEEQK